MPSGRFSEADLRARRDAARGYRSLETSLVRKTLREIIDDIVFAGRRTVITRHGRPVAALVSLRDFDLLAERDAAVDERLLGRRAPAGGAIGLRDFAAGAGIARPQSVASKDMSTERLADEVVDRFLDEILVPALAQQARAVVGQMIAHEFGNVREVSGEDAPAIREWLLESLRASAKAPEIASDD